METKKFFLRDKWEGPWDDMKNKSRSVKFKRILLGATNWMLSELIKANQWYFDATFKCSPHNFYQTENILIQ